MSRATRKALLERFEALLEEARASGRLPELLPELRARLEAAAASTPEAPAGAVAGGPAEKPGAPPGRFGMIGASPAIERVFALIEKVRTSDVSVLIQGETGTGKELVARALHECGPRAGRVFLAENCAAVPAALLESELFAHTRGSFTGAVADRTGHFVAADGGTVFLDEIGDMPLTMQSKLLRVLQEGEVRPVGSNRTVHVDVRVLAATNKDLRAMCAGKTFREDLYFRLGVVNLQLPPLRERGEDVLLLARTFLERATAEMGRRPLALEPEAEQALLAWRWPGNVRELENEMRRVAALSPPGRTRVGRAELSAHVAAPAAGKG